MGWYWQKVSRAGSGSVQTNPHAFFVEVEHQERVEPGQRVRRGSNLRGVAHTSAVSCVDWFKRSAAMGQGWDRPPMTWSCALSLWQTQVRW